MSRVGLTALAAFASLSAQQPQRPVFRTAVERAPLETASAVTAHLEVYATPPAPPGDLRVLVEVAPDARAPALASEEAQVDESDDPTRLLAQGTLTVDTVRSGSFIVRAIVLVDGTEVGRVSRALRRR